MLFRRAYASKMSSLLAGNGPKHGIWDRILFNKVAAVIGGNVQLVV